METRTRKSAAERREEIARAALRIVGERGLTALTMATLAEAVGVTSGALFRHFESREAILDEAVRRALTEIEATFPDPSLPPRERLFALARNRVRVLREEPGFAWLLRSQQAHLSLPRDAVERLQDMAMRSKRFLLAALSDGVAEGGIRGDIDPELLLVPVIGTIHALVGQPGVHRGPAAAQATEPDRVLEALERLLAPPSVSDPPDRGADVSQSLKENRP